MSVKRGVIVVGALCLLAIVAAIIIPSMITGPKLAGNEGATIGALKTIFVAETVFKDGAKDGKLGYGSLARLDKAGVVDSVLGSGTKQGYLFRVEPGKDPEKTFWAVAWPAIPGTTGDRIFYTNQTGVISAVPLSGQKIVEGWQPPLPDPETGAPPPGAAPLSR